MRCPFCAHDDSQVKDSRPTEDNTTIRRRRQCEGCGARFTTFERVQLREITVVKSEDRKMDQLVSGIQRQLETSGETEIPSQKIGEMVMDGLKALDSVAYIRFASVYKDFTEAKDFKEFAGTLKDVGGA